MSQLELPANLADDDAASAAQGEPCSQSFAAFAPAATRVLSTDEVLFAAGSPRTQLYRVEAGAICVTRALDDGSRQVIDLALPGDLVGFGSRPHHSWTAEAVGETRVRCLPASAEAYFAALDAKSRNRRDRALARELDAVRDALVERGRADPVTRLAALLVVLAHTNAAEGRDETLITERFTCGAIADYLDLRLDEMAGHLVELSAQGLVACEGEHGLRLRDLAALERLADR